MYSIFFLGCCVFVAALVLELDRLRELLPAGLAGSVFASLPLGLVGGVLPMHYQDTPPLVKHVAISLVIQAVVAPLLGMWYVQKLSTRWTQNAIRMMLFVGLQLTLEGMGRQAGRVSSAAWWDWKASTFIYLLFFLACHGAYRLYHSNDKAGSLQRVPNQPPTLGG